MGILLVLVHFWRSKGANTKRKEQGVKKRQVKIPTGVWVVLGVLFAGWLFGFSGLIPGKDAAKARGLQEKLAAQVPPGTSRADAEAFLKREGIKYHYYSRGDGSFSDVIISEGRRDNDHPNSISVEKIHGFTDSSLDTKYALVPGQGERVFLQFLFDKNEKMLGYQWYAFAPGF